MMNIIKLIFGAILMYVGGKIIYRTVKPKEEEVRTVITEVRRTFKKIDDIDF